ncbi:hypothetical protein [Lysobacter antibioticus]|uniref:hypothetical protein n=1 Tax=Lysobacter antibioticus TaxID=84531 RepID=UPI0011875E7F|nr:hypothetical protein [Lysobacter antibioticus]
MNLLAMILLPVALVIPTTSHANGDCDKPIDGVQIIYSGVDADRARDWGYVYGKYVLINGSKKTLRFATYKGEREPVKLYPLVFTIEKQTVDGWSDDVTVIDHPEAATATVTVPPGDRLTFLGQSRPAGPDTYRAKIRQMRGCWLPSEPFQVSNATESSGPH